MPVLEKIVISDFRNIELQELEFSPNINCISGNNGEGKTNLLDAIHYLSMTKSAFATSDRFSFRHGQDEFSLLGTYKMENGLNSRFALKMNSKGEKMLWNSFMQELVQCRLVLQSWMKVLKYLAKSMKAWKSSWPKKDFHQLMKWLDWHTGSCKYD